MSVFGYTLLSVLIVSAVSFIGAITIAASEGQTNDEPPAWLQLLIGLAIGALLGDVAIHLLPEAYANIGAQAPIYLIGGFLIFFILEKLLHWRHHHASVTSRVEPYGVMNLVGDGLHNFIDGALIAASYLVSFPIGLATTIAVVLHEIPQELGDYAILRSAGFTRKAALGFNFLSALAAVVGAMLVLGLQIDVEAGADKILAFTAGGFLYIVVLLLRKLGEEMTAKRVFGQLVMIGLGFALMWLITFIE